MATGSQGAVLKLRLKGLCTPGFWGGAGRKPRTPRGPSQGWKAMVREHPEAPTRLPCSSKSLQQSGLTAQTRLPKTAPLGSRSLLYLPAQPQEVLGWGSQPPGPLLGWGNRAGSAQKQEYAAGAETGPKVEGSWGRMKAFLASRPAGHLHSRVGEHWVPPLTPAHCPLARSRALVARSHWPRCRRHQRC